MNNVKLNYMKS